MNYWSIIIILGFAVILFIYLKREKAGQSLRGSILSLYSRDLTALALQNKLDPVVGRENEIAKVIQILSRRTKNNPVLLGEAGVGKTAIVEGLAEAIIKKQVPINIQNKRVLALDLSGILAGTKYRGEFEERLKKVVNEIIAREREIILFIDEIHSLSEAGEATGAIGAVDILKPALSRGELQMVGATTISEYKKFIEPDVTLERRFQPVIVGEPAREQTIEILKGIKNKYEEYHHVKIPEEFIDEIVDYSKDFKGRVYPDKAIDLMDEAAAKVSLKMVKKGQSDVQPEVALEVIKEVHDEWVKMNQTI